MGKDFATNASGANPVPIRFNCFSCIHAQPRTTPAIAAKWPTRRPPEVSDEAVLWPIPLAVRQDSDVPAEMHRWAGWKPKPGFIAGYVLFRLIIAKPPPGRRSSG